MIEWSTVPRSDARNVTDQSSLKKVKTKLRPTISGTSSNLQHAFLVIVYTEHLMPEAAPFENEVSLFWKCTDLPG